MSAALAAVAAALYAAAVLMFARLHASRAYSVVSHAVSDYGVGPTAGRFRLYGLTGTLAAAALAAAVATAPAAAGLPRRVVVMLAALAVLRLGVLAAPTDLEGQRMTRTGALHLLFAVATFALTYMAIDAAGPAAEAMAGGLAPLLAGLGWLVTLALAAVVVTLLPPLRRVFGLSERVFLLGSMLWLMALAVLLARLPAPPAA